MGNTGSSGHASWAPWRSPAKGTGLSLLWDGKVCRAEASAAEGLARALLWSGLAVRELQASEGQRPGKGGALVPNGLIFFFSVHHSLLFLKVGPPCSNVSLAGGEGILTHCGPGALAPQRSFF